jgi:hypothetical protein
MNDNNYRATIEVVKSPEDVFEIITSDVSKWWGGKDLKGNTTNEGDEFIVFHPGAHYSKQKLIEVISQSKVVWLVTESTLEWIEKDKSEWTNTKMIFELTPNGDTTVLSFTHEGLVPEKECYQRVGQDWTIVIKQWLFNYISSGKVPDQLYH